MGCTFRVPALLLVASALLASRPPAASAGNVVTMNLATMADLTGQAIVGRVESTRSYWAPDPRRIETEITFTNVEYLKGELPDSGDRFTLVVPGGTVGDTRMRIGCAPTFQVGQRWFLMLLPTYKTFPVVGLSQGCFEIRTGTDGVERLFTSSNLPLTAVTSDGFVRSGKARRRYDRARLIEGVGMKVLSDVAADQPTEAMPFEEFKAIVQPILTASQAYRLAAPAGQRVLVEYRPVALQLTGDKNMARQPSRASRSVTRKFDQRSAPAVQP